MSYGAGMVDQIVIGWAERTLTRASGIGPTATSLTSRAELARWEQRLLAADWAAAEAAGPPGRPALVYLQFGPEAAVLHKETVKDQHGRGGSPLTHALIGPVSSLDAKVALGLHDWNGWVREDSQPTEFGRLDGGELRHLAGSGYQALRSRSRELEPRTLGALIASVLSDPTGRFSVFSPPEEGADARLVPAVELMCGLLDILRPVLDRDWTFSTGEATEPVSTDRPGFVFLVGAPRFSTRAPTGHRIKVGQPAWLGRQNDAAGPGPDELLIFGVALADAYARMGPGAIERTRPAQRIVAADGALAWAARAQFSPGVIDDFGNLLHNIGLGRIEPEAVAAIESRPGYLENGLAEMSTEIFGYLTNCWEPEAPASKRHPAIAEAIRGAAARRYLAAGLVPDMVPGDQPAREIVIALGVPTSTWIGQVGRFLPDSGVQSVAAMVDRLTGCIPLGDDPALADELSDLPLPDLLELAATYADRRPTLSEALLRTAARRRTTTSFERIEALQRLEFVVDFAHRHYPDAPAAAASFLTEIIRAMTGPELGPAGVPRQLLDRISAIGSAPLLWALAAIVPPDRRADVLAEAGNRWFRASGLDPLSASPPRQETSSAVTREVFPPEDGTAWGEIVTTPGPADAEAGTGDAAAAKEAGAHRKRREGRRNRKDRNDQQGSPMPPSRRGRALLGNRGLNRDPDLKESQ